MRWLAVLNVYDVRGVFTCSWQNAPSSPSSMISIVRYNSLSNVRELGEGCFGVTYVAEWDTSMSPSNGAKTASSNGKKLVAIKVPKVLHLLLPCALRSCFVPTLLRRTRLALMNGMNSNVSLTVLRTQMCFLFSEFALVRA